MYQTILLETDAHGVATLTLNRPDKHNALNTAMIAELTDAAALLADSTAARVVVLAGAGETFCAGGDLSWMQAQFEASRETRIAQAHTFARMLHALNTIPKPLIGRVHGPAFGGGLGMMSVCDIVIAADSARFALTEVRLGLLPATIAPYVIGRIGEAKARQVILSGRRFDAEEAARLGLVSRVVARDAIAEAVAAEAQAFRAAAPGAVARTKALVRSFGPALDGAAISRTVEALADAWEDAEAHEGISAFFDRRKPAWTG